MAVIGVLVVAAAAADRPAPAIKIVEVTPQTIRTLPFRFVVDFMRHEDHTWLEFTVVTRSDPSCREAFIELWENSSLALRCSLRPTENRPDGETIYRVDMSDRAQPRAVFVWRETDCRETPAPVEYRACVADFIPRE